MIPFTSTGKPFLDSLLQRICEEIQDFQTKCRLEHPDRYVTLVMLQDRLEEEWHRYIDDDVKTIVSAEMLEKAFLEIQQWLPTFSRMPRIVVKGKTDEPLRNWVTEEVRSRRYYWPLLARKMRGPFDRDAQRQIDEESEGILRLMPNPMDITPWHAYGLVIGQVQSGKTSNYSALMAKAADAGYRMIVVLAGIHDDLRNQTQERLDEDFLGERNTFDPLKRERVRELVGVGTFVDVFDSMRAPRRATYTDTDFQDCPVQGEDLPWLFVVKKNRAVLQRLNRWAKDSDVTDRWPLLMIDDEADQASINTAKNPERATAINREIRQLLQQFTRSCYVGYTATPFANILIDANVETKQLGKDLFPRNFIYHLEASPKYYGPTFYFGDELDSIPEAFMLFGEEHKQNWINALRKGLIKAADEMPIEVEHAILQFLLSSGIWLWRQCREKTDLQLEEKPLSTSMLVHVTHLVREQGLVRQGVERVLRDLRKIWHVDRQSFFKKIEPFWESQRDKVTPSLRHARQKQTGFDNPEFWCLPADLITLEPYISEVLLGLEVHLVNGQSKHPVVFYVDSAAREYPRVKPVLYIGGNKLSRGLTLPGLCVSVFLRGSNMYDTLLQMGRWFGYRDGYADLCRISTTADLIERFRVITEATVDLEQQVLDMNVNKRTPDRYRLTVLAHPGLFITASNKARQAVDSKHYYNGVVVENRKFRFVERGRVIYAERYVRPALDFMRDVKKKGNLVYADKSFFDGNLSKTVINYKNIRSGDRQNVEGRLWQDVPADVVVSFLERYNNGDKDLVRAIRKRNEKGHLVRWTVFLPGPQEDNPFFKSRPIRRSSYTFSSETSELLLTVMLGGEHQYCGVSQTLIDATDKRISEKQGEGKSVKGVYFRELRKIAGRDEPEVGHLILYNIRPGKDVAKLPALSDKGFGNGALLPIVGFFLWLPKMPDEHDALKGLGNRTVPIFLGNEDFEETEDDKDDEL